MKQIQLIASDLDGTLLTSKKEVTPRLYQALETLYHMGIHFVPATGRPFGSLPQDIRNLPFLKYVITSNGASIYDAENQETLLRNLLSPEAVEITLSVAKKLPVLMEFFLDGHAYIAQKAFENLSSYGLTESHIHYIRTTRTPVEDFWGTIERQKANLENINLVFQDMELRKETLALLREKGHTSVTASSSKNIEITSPEATKSKALATLCHRLDIDPIHTLALGDSDNDLPMLQFAGVGIAMANGEAHIKAAADRIADDCNSFGAAKILEEIIAQKGYYRENHTINKGV